MKINLPDILEIIFRHKLKIFFLPLIILAGTLFVILFFPRTYQSQAKLFLQVGRETLGVDPSAKASGTTVSLMQSDRDEEVKSALEVIQSSGIYAGVVDQLTPEYVLGGSKERESTNTVFANTVFAFMDVAIGSVVKTVKSIDPIEAREEAIIKMAKSFIATAERNTTVLNLAYESKSPEAAKKILEAIIENYRSEHLRIHRNPDSEAFLADQATSLENQWVKAKEAVVNAKAKFGVVTLDGKKASLEGKIQKIDLDLMESIAKISNAKATISDLRSRLAAIPERETTSKKSVPNGGADLMREDFYTNQLRLTELRAKLSPSHPLLMATEKQVEEGKRILQQESESREEIVDDLNPLHKDIKRATEMQMSSLAGLEAEKSKLEVQKAELTESIAEFNKAEVEISRLEQEVAIAKAKYSQYSDNLQEASFNKAMEESAISSVNIQSKPQLEQKPIRPSKVLVGLGGVFLAFASVLGSILISEKMDDRLRSAKEIAEITELPVLGTLAESIANKRISYP
jgi:uncharacterized protein involved in exopolysaccharide biosynthesis